MEKFLDFFMEVGKLKDIKRRGWLLIGIKNPETIAAHTFRMAVMSWFLSCCKKKLDVNKVIKMCLIHDLCEVYAGDTTPYDSILPKDKRKWKSVVNKWPRLSKAKKERLYREKYEKENNALEKLITEVPSSLKKEIRRLWDDYENGLTREGRFVRQLDRVENLLQALEYMRKTKGFVIEPWWIRTEELVDDPILIEFMNNLEEKFYPKCKRQKR